MVFKNGDIVELLSLDEKRIKALNSEGSSPKDYIGQRYYVENDYGAVEDPSPYTHNDIRLVGAGMAGFPSVFKRHQILLYKAADEQCKIKRFWGALKQKLQRFGLKLT